MPTPTIIPNVRDTPMLIQFPPVGATEFAALEGVASDAAFEVALAYARISER